MNRIDRYIIKNMFFISFLVLVLLIIVFIIIDFSENVDDFTDRGAALSEIWGDYYLNYIPEIIRLVLPVSIFTACLLLTGKMSQRFEIIALKAAGVSLYRLLLPFLIFSTFCAAMISYMDGFIVPKSNKDRIEFERKYLMTRSDRIEGSRIYRQEARNTLMSVNYYAPEEQIGYRVQLYTFDGPRVVQTVDIGRMEYNEETSNWQLFNVRIREIDESGYKMRTEARMDTVFTILPRDLARTSSDVYQLTYPEVLDYIESLKRIGASDIELPKVQFYGKLFYPISIIIITILGVSIASVRRAGGMGYILGAGLFVSFLYISLIKIIEPFGAAGAIDPFWAALLPHAFFAVTAIAELLRTPK